MSDFGGFARGLFRDAAHLGLIQGYVTDADLSTKPPTYTVSPDNSGGSTGAPGVKSMIPVMIGDTVWMAKTASGSLIIVSYLETGWHNVGGSGEPAFQNGWTNYPAWTPARFRKVGGIVIVQGLVQHLAGNVAGSVVFTLPAGYRPLNYILFSASSANGATEVNTRTDVGPDGSVYLGSTFASGSGYHSLSGVSFPAEQ